MSRLRIGRSLLGAIACAAFAASLLTGAATADTFLPFDASSLAAIRSIHADKPFVLAFWSIHCEPCRDEMGHWNALRRKYPGTPIILVATDPPAERATMIRFLARFNPGTAEQWAFADEFVERVRYSVDPSWRGELPRAYFYDASHRAVARSGSLDMQWLERWFAEHGKRSH